jgi:hypothetical protein
MIDSGLMEFASWQSGNRIINHSRSTYGTRVGLARLHTHTHTHTISGSIGDIAIDTLVHWYSLHFRAKSLKRKGKYELSLFHQRERALTSGGRAFEWHRLKHVMSVNDDECMCVFQA